jgi:hypothetical protein
MVIKLFNSKISKKYVSFIFVEVKCIATLSENKIQIICCDFFQSCVINHFY